MNRREAMARKKKARRAKRVAHRKPRPKSVQIRQRGRDHAADIGMGILASVLAASATKRMMKGSHNQKEREKGEEG